MVQAKTALSENSATVQPEVNNQNALQYEQIIAKLLTGINEVTYLLQNKNYQ